MGKRSKYQSAPIGSEDLQQALEWLDGGLSGATITLRLVRPRTGAPYLHVCATGYRRATKIGQKARLVAEARYPASQYGSIIACMYNLCYTLAERAEYEDDIPNGRYTELIPGWPRKA